MVGQDGAVGEGIKVLRIWEEGALVDAPIAEPGTDFAKPPEAPKPVNSSIRAGSEASEPEISPVIVPFWINSTRSDKAVIKSRLCSTRTIAMPLRLFSDCNNSIISSMIEGWMPSVG